MLFPFMLNGLATPDSVKDKWPCWCVLIFLLLILLVIKMVILDFINAMLTVLMITLGYMIVRNRMENAGHLVMIYSVLCMLNFAFDMVPLIIDLSGRLIMKDGRKIVDVAPGMQRIRLTRSLRTADFFDYSLGLKYNLQSASLILSPICMLIGSFLSLKAVYEIHNTLEDDDLEGPFFGGYMGATGYGVGEQVGQPAPANAGNVQAARGAQFNQPFRGKPQRLGK